MHISGASDLLNATRQALSANLLIAVVVSYLLLVAIFSHWGYPLLILASVPIGISGGIVGLWLLNAIGENLERFGLAPIHQPFDMITMLGFLVLIGTVVNNPILIVERTLSRLRQGGVSATEAVSFYEFHSCLMEPWDGPASIAFTDGTQIGAVLDRNGLRPSRYYITDDHKCIMASEVGVVEIDPARIIDKGRLKPGRMFLIDFEQGRMIPNEEIKTTWAKQRPYRDWLEQHKIELGDLAPAVAPRGDVNTLRARMHAFGYTQESMQLMLLPLVKELRDPLGSMGNDAALAVMSDKPRILYDYFKQRFAQVTNPPVDSIREELIMALEAYIGPEGNLLESTPVHCRRLRIESPIISNDELAAIKAMDHRGWRTFTIDMTFPREWGGWLAQSPGTHLFTGEQRDCRWLFLARAFR